MHSKFCVARHNKEVNQLRMYLLLGDNPVNDFGKYGKHISIMGRQEEGQGAGFSWSPGIVKGIESLSLDSTYAIMHKSPGSISFEPNEKYVIK